MAQDRISLKEKVAIVTGAGRGIGEACALAFADAGANVVIAARTREQIENVGAPLIGAVLNRFDSRGSSGFGYDYGYGDGYRYRYGSYHDDPAQQKGLFKKRTKKVSNV